MFCRQGPLPIADACELIRQAAVGLQQTTGGMDLATTGQVMGTVDYMAPEQAGASHTVDIRADIYNLGAALYKLLTGVAPFSGERHATLLNKLTALAVESPQPVRTLRSDVPEALIQIVERLLAKFAADRFATAGDVATALVSFTKEQHVTLLLAGSASGVADTKSRHSTSTAKHLSGSLEETAASGSRKALPILRTRASPLADHKGSARTARPSASTSAKARLPQALRQPPIIAAIVGLFLLGAGGLHYGITILIKDKDGKVVGKVELPEETKGEVLKDGKKIADIDADGITSAATPRNTSQAPVSKPTVRSVTITPENIPTLPDRASLNDQCVVSSPAKLPGTGSSSSKTALSLLHGMRRSLPLHCSS